MLPTVPNQPVGGEILGSRLSSVNNAKRAITCQNDQTFGRIRFARPQSASPVNDPHGDDLEHELTESQVLLKRAARDFFSRDYPLERMREIAMSHPGYDLRLWHAMTELGWPAAAFEEHLGGYPGSFSEVAVLLEELGWAAASSPFASTVAVSGLALQHGKPELIGRVIEGAILAPVLRAAQRTGEHESESRSDGIVDGVFHGVAWAEQADVFVLSNQNFTVIVPADDPAIEISEQSSTALDPRYRVAFANVTGEVVPIEAATEDPELLGATAHALLLSGMSGRALDLATSYARERIQFGKPIGAFQAIQHKCADMAVSVQVGRYLAHKAAWAHGDSPSTFERSARYAKVFTGDAAAFVTRQAIQVHGGVGFVDTHRVQLFYRGALAAAADYGTSHEHRRHLADQILTTGVR